MSELACVWSWSYIGSGGKAVCAEMMPVWFFVVLGVVGGVAAGMLADRFKMGWKGIVAVAVIEILAVNSILLGMVTVLTVVRGY